MGRNSRVFKGVNKMRKILLVCLMLSMVSVVCNAEPIFMDFECNTDYVVGFTGIGLGSYLLCSSNPAIFALGAVTFVGGFYVVKNTYRYEMAKSDCLKVALFGVKF